MLLSRSLTRYLILRPLCLILPLCAAVIGCSSPPSNSEEYSTIAVDPRRDTDMAQQENAKAAQLLEEGRYEEAEVSLKRALAADVMHGPAHNNLGLVYFHQKKLYLAAWEFQYAAKLMPHHTEPKNNLGLIFEAANKLDDAVEQYELARALEPDNPQFIGNAVRARIKRGEKDERIADLLRQVVFKDDREEWVEWAKEKLARMGKPEAPSTLPK